MIHPKYEQAKTVTEEAGPELAHFKVARLSGARVTAVSDAPEGQGAPVKPERQDFPSHVD